MEHAKETYVTCKRDLCRTQNLSRERDFVCTTSSHFLFLLPKSSETPHKKARASEKEIQNGKGRVSERERTTVCERARMTEREQTSKRGRV